MPLDTTIPLQVQIPKFEDYSQLAAQTQANALRSQIAQQEMQQNALRMQYMQEDRARAEANRAASARQTAENRKLLAEAFKTQDPAKYLVDIGRPELLDEVTKYTKSSAESKKAGFEADKASLEADKLRFAQGFAEVAPFASLIANGIAPAPAVADAVIKHPIVGPYITKIMTPEQIQQFAIDNPKGVADFLATPPDKIYDAVVKPPEVKGQLTEAQKLREKRATADDYNMATTALRDIQDVTRTVDKLASTDLGGVTGYASVVPSLSETSLKAESDIESLKGKMTALAKTLSAASGKLGNLAVAEYQMLRDQIAAFDPYRGEAATRQQLNDIKTTMSRIENSVRDVYSRTYGGEDNPFTQFRELPGEIGTSSAKTQFEGFTIKEK